MNEEPDSEELQKWADDGGKPFDYPDISYIQDEDHEELKTPHLHLPSFIGL